MSQGMSTEQLLYSVTDGPGPRAVTRPMGKPHGVYIAEKVAKHCAIALCSNCQHKFYHRQYNYHLAKRWGLTTGFCDGCRDFHSGQYINIHGSTVCDSGGKIRNGHVYTPL